MGLFTFFTLKYIMLSLLSQTVAPSWADWFFYALGFGLGIFVFFKVFYCLVRIPCANLRDCLCGIIGSQSKIDVRVVR